MRLVFLGTTGYHPSETRHTLCLMLPECGLMLDAGTSLFRAVDYLETPALDIFLTHAHLDHIIGLTYLFDLLYLKPLERITVHAEADKLRAIDEHLFFPAIFPKKPPFEGRALAADVPLPQGGRLHWFPLTHPGGVVGYRLDWPGHSMAYVTDTTATVDVRYLDEIRGVDLLVHECYFADGMEEWADVTGHSCTTPVAQVARAADVGRLVLVHLNPLAAEPDPIGIERARSIFPRTELASDRMEIEF